MEFTDINDQTRGFASGFRNKFPALNRSTLSIIGLLVLLLGIPLAVWLLQRTQVFAPRAVEPPIQLVTGGGSCVVSKDPNKVTCATFPVKLTSPLGPPPSGNSGCSSDSDCSAGNKCFKHQNYIGSCRPADTVCAQVITRACDPLYDPVEPLPSGAPSDFCVDFPTPCHVPSGWVVR